MFTEIIDALQIKNCEETSHAQFAVHEILERHSGCWWNWYNCISAPEV